MRVLVSYLRGHRLVWLVPLVLVPLVVGLVCYLAHAESSTPDSPFIYEVF